MRTIVIQRGRIGKRALLEATRVLRAGGVVVFPTETSYGLAVDPSNRDAIRRIYVIKGRSESKPLPLIAASRPAVEKTFVLHGVAKKLALRHWPGPLTLVLPLKKKGLPAANNGKDGAIRVPSSAWARALARSCGGIITSTSANLSGDAALHDPDDIVRAFSSKKITPDLFLNAGRLPSRTASTIVRVKRGILVVLRAGAVEVTI